MRSYSKDDKEKGKREFRNAVNNIDRLLCVAKQYQVVPYRNDKEMMILERDVVSKNLFLAREGQIIKI